MRIVPVSALALCTLLATGCGGRPDPPDAPVASPLPCPFDLDAVGSHTTRVTYAGSTAVTMSFEAAAPYFVAQSDEREETYLCDASGLRLVSLREGALELAWSPGLMVLPGQGAEGASTGSMTYRDGTTTYQLPYSHAWQALPASGPESLDIRGDYVEVASALFVEHASETYRWQTETVWLRAIGVLVPVARDQLSETPDGVQTQRHLATDVAW